MVVCKENNKAYYGLTPGKKYKVVDVVTSPIFPSERLYYKIINDNGDIQGWIVSDLFISIDEYREKSLNELGI